MCHLFMKASNLSDLALLFFFSFGKLHLPNVLCGNVTAPHQLQNPSQQQFRHSLGLTHPAAYTNITHITHLSNYSSGMGAERMQSYSLNLFLRSRPT